MCEAFQRAAAIAPDAVALRTPGDTQTLTWREYAAEVRRVAAGLAGIGVRRGDTVSLMMANRIEFYPLEVGAQHLGATSFSVYNTLPAEQLTYLFDNAGTKVVICEAAVRRPDPGQRRDARPHRLHRRCAGGNDVARRALRRRSARFRFRRRPGARCTPTT